ncbi:hypothetical protein VJY32_09685 [Ignavibacteria bacterium 4148-Me]|uniref:hypothetical protein n=1 Tax=Rosettibacter primus TaxID=3111523 RepID=UPI00336BBFD2
MAVKKEEENFIGLEKVVETLSNSFAKANNTISENAKRSKEPLAFIASDVSISFQAEFKIVENKPVVRFMSVQQQALISKKKGAEEAKPEIKNAATITINLRPVPA